MFLKKNKSPMIISIVIALLIGVVLIGLMVLYFEHSGGNHERPKNATPMVINTWKFEPAAQAAWEYIAVRNKSAVDAIVAGCSACERLQCKRTVGFGGSPDESGETTLDALIIDGSTMNMGAVGGLRYIKDAISAARKVLDYTKHTLMAGDLASQFAIDMGFIPTTLSTDESTDMWKSWKQNSCQPNFWTNVSPDPTKKCGPYEPIGYDDKLSTLPTSKKQKNTKVNLSVNEHNHDTVTMLAIDRYGNVAAGGSTNGLSHKIAGRVGDTSIPGAGAYADNSVGAASATGNGDLMMRFLPSFLAVEEMRHGATPQEAAETAVKRIKNTYPDFFGAIISINIYGEYGAACNGMPLFPYCVVNPTLQNVTVVTALCFR